MLRKLFDTGIFAVVQFLASIALNFFLSKMLSPDDFGRFFLVITTVQLIVVFISFGSSGTFVRFSKELITQGKFHSLISKLNSYYLVLVGATILVGLLLSDFFSKAIFSSDDSIYVYALLLQLPFVLFNQNVTSIFWSFNDFIRKGINQNGFYYVLTILVSISYLFYKDIRIEYIIIFLIASRVLNALIGTILSRKYLDVSMLFKFSGSLKLNTQVSSYLRFGIWTGISTLFIMSIDFVERISINNFLDSYTLGLYTSTFALFSYIYMPFQLLSNVILTYYLKDWNTNSHGVLKKIQLITVVSLALFGIICSIVIFNYNTLILNFFGEDYVGLSSEVLMYFFIAFYLKMIYTLTSSISFISNKPKILSFSLLVALIITVLVNLILTPIYGLKGVLIGSIIAKLLLIVILYFQYNAKKIYFSIKYYLAVLSLLALFLIFFI
jgi:O-antigen/teichoic acid export membrane protein